MESIAASPTMFRLLRDYLCTVVVLLSLALAGACATGRLVAPPATQLRQSIDTVELQVMAKSTPNWRATESLRTDPGYQANQQANGAAETIGEGALGAVAIGCDLQWDILWFFTCPGSLIIGAGAAVVGTVGAGVYGAATAHDQDEVEAAAASLDRSLFETRIADDLRGRLVSTIHESTTIKVLSDERSRADAKTGVGGDNSVVVFALDIERFNIVREGQVSPDLRLEFIVTGAIYEFPKLHPRYERRWQLNSDLGNFYSLTASGAIGLRQELHDAFDKMAATIVDDIFVTQYSTRTPNGNVVDGLVVTLYGFEQPPVAESSSTTIPSGTLGSYLRYQAAHGNADAAARVALVTGDPGTLRMLAVEGVPGAAVSLFDVLSGTRNTNVEAWRALCNAADSGNEKARETLGLWHQKSYWQHSSDERLQWARNDVGVQPNNLVAYMWYTLASSNSGSGANFLRGYLAEAMTPDEIAQAEQMARDWKPDDCPSAEHRLGVPGET